MTIEIKGNDIRLLMTNIEAMNLASQAATASVAATKGYCEGLASFPAPLVQIDAKGQQVGHGVPGCVYLIVERAK